MLLFTMSHLGVVISLCFGCLISDTISFILHFCFSIRISLVDESMVIRAAALRVLRYLIKIESDVATFNTLKLPYLVMRYVKM